MEYLLIINLDRNAPSLEPVSMKLLGLATLLIGRGLTQAMVRTKWQSLRPFCLLQTPAIHPS
jgi:hypothetical protein